MKKDRKTGSHRGWFKYIQKTDSGIELRRTIIDSESKTNRTYYYVYYTSRTDEEGYFKIFTSKEIFLEEQVVYITKDRNEIIRVADAINNTIRLFAGYGDN